MGIVTQTIAATDPETAGEFGSELQYSLTTVPDPLTVSPASGNVELGDLIIVGSRISPTSIETNEIAVYLPIGSEAWQLVLDYTGLQTAINLTGWTATPDPANERILFKPNAGHATITPEQGLTVQLNKLRINRQVGTSPVVMALKWRAPGTSSWRTEEQTLSIGKFPVGFYLRNLKPESPYIDNGDSVTLTWERSEGPTYHLLYENTEIDVTGYSTFTVHDIRRNTMFYLRGRIQQGTGTAERTINTYITVNRPDLEVGNLTVHGEFVMPSIPRIAYTTLGVTEPHTPDLMLDGSLQTYYWSADHPKTGDSIWVDLGVQQVISSVYLYLGDLNGGFGGPPCSLSYSTDGTGWRHMQAYNWGSGEIYYHATQWLKGRYVRLRMHGSTGQRFAIRSFEVGTKPKAVLLTPSSAVFGVPVAMDGGTASSASDHIGTEHSTAPVSADGTPPPTEPSGLA